VRLGVVLAVGLAVVVACVAASEASAAQEEGPLDALLDAYRSGSVVDRMEIEVPRASGPALRDVMTIAIRKSDDPAVSLSMGEANPLRVVAEPGRLIAWRAGDRSRVFVAPLPEPFGRESLETVLPPLLAPQLDLAFADPPSRMLAFMPPLSWSLVASGELDRYAGVSLGASLELSAGRDGRLAAIEARRGGRLVARASIEALQSDADWFEAPSLDVEVVATLAELGEPPAPVRAGEVFGDAIGTDARGRVATLRGVAGEGDRVVVLALSARLADERARLVGQLAEARLAPLAAMLDATLVLLVVGDASSARVFERVTRTSRADAGRVRAIAVDRRPAWLGDLGQGVAFAVDGGPWMLLAEHRIATDDDESVQHGPFESSVAPRSLAERLAEAVGAAMRE
jgi:hypothetical protein